MGIKNTLTLKELAEKKIKKSFPNFDDDDFPNEDEAKKLKDFSDALMDDLLDAVTVVGTAFMFGHIDDIDEEDLDNGVIGLQMKFAEKVFGKFGLVVPEGSEEMLTNLNDQIDELEEN